MTGFREGLLVVGVVLGCLGCDKSKDAPPPADKPAISASVAVAPSASAPPKPTRPEKPLNVLLLTIDSLRADHAPWAGYERKTLPNLAKLAAEGVVYEHAYSVSSYTAKSVAALLSGRYPTSLYRSGWFFANYATSNDFFTEALQAKGIRTIGWHAHMYFGRGKGLDQGFDVWELAPGIVFDPNTDNSVTSEKMAKLGEELLGKSENTGKQFFAWAHFMDPHDQYQRHAEAPDWGNKNADRYDQELFHTDLWVGKLLDFARKQPWWKNTAVIISADHGEAFGEHGMWKHAFELWEVLTRVPLVIYGPGIEPRRIKQRRSCIDVAPTIMDLMGQKPLESFMGESLVPELYGAEPPERDVIVTELAEDSHNPYRRAVLQGDYKLIVYGKGWKHQLYNVKTDPGEEKDLSKEEPEKLEELKKVFEKTYAKIPFVAPYGGMKLKEGGSANGPTGPAKAE